MDPWKNDNQWFVSPYNYAPAVTSSVKFADRIELHDITLRDGEQQAGVVFTRDDKIRIAEALADVGVHRIEAGMPSVSKDDAAAIKDIVRRRLGPKIFAFCRCMVSDVKQAVDCGVDGIVIEIPSSQHIITYAYGWPLERAIDLSIEATQYAKSQGLYTVFFPIDGTRAEADWFLNLIERVAREGHMDALGLVDTFGGCSPHAIAEFTRRVQSRITKPLETHFHDDFGMAAANTITSLAMGVPVAHVTVSSLGERAGNAALEDVAMALRVLYGVDLGIRYDKLYGLSRLVQKLARFQLPSNRPIVGDMLFKVESGIISSWLSRCKAEQPVELFPFHWSMVGQAEADVVTGKGNGRDSIAYRLRAWGRDIASDDPRIDAILAGVKDASLRKHALLDDREFRAIVSKVLKLGNGRRPPRGRKAPARRAGAAAGRRAGAVRRHRSGGRRVRTATR
ncbi:MAG TPA: pyruvate carboxyltransferase [bacterium]|nr:pyruvate carboxyltransferase [bacterium]